MADERCLLGPVSVRERRHREPAAESCQARHSVRPGGQALPSSGQLIACEGIKRLQAQVTQHRVQRQAVQPVEVRPWELAAPHPVHRRHVLSAPGICQTLPVGIDVLRRADTSGLGRHARAPVHGGAEDVEGEGTHVAQVGGWNGHQA